MPHAARSFTVTIEALPESSKIQPEAMAITAAARKITCFIFQLQMVGFELFGFRLGWRSIDRRRPILQRVRVAPPHRPRGVIRADHRFVPRLRRAGLAHRVRRRPLARTHRGVDRAVRLNRAHARVHARDLPALGRERCFHRFQIHRHFRHRPSPDSRGRPCAAPVN